MCYTVKIPNVSNYLYAFHFNHLNFLYGTAYCYQSNPMHLYVWVCYTYAYLKVQCAAPSFVAARTPDLIRNTALLMFYELFYDIIGRVP